MSYPPPSGPSEPNWGDQQPPNWGNQPPGWGDQPHKGGPAHWGEPPPYPSPPPYGPYGPPPGSGSTNVLAILALVFAFVFAPAGIVLGHLAKRQIRETHEQGEQLAQWGLILSYVFSGLYLLLCCGWIGLIVWAGTNSGTTT